jgi:hypothetical protein
LPLDEALLNFILEQLKDAARECGDIRAAERLRTLATEIKGGAVSSAGAGGALEGVLI